MLKHRDEGWLLDRYRIRNTINSEMLPYLRMSNNQFDPETGLGSRNLSFNLNSNLKCNLFQKSNKDTCILAQHPFLNRNVERMQIAIQSMKTATQDEIMGKIIVSNVGAHCKKGKRNPIHTFPYKLHKMLSDPKFSKCISWLPHGRAWKIIRRTQFENDVLPHHFRHGRYSSFMRQVSKLQGLSQLKTKKQTNGHDSRHSQKYIR
jgi:HSF-type DNA-binding